MPMIFSPGEAETRPLDPEAIVYTTAQKVADLLGIGPQEAVLMSANAEANAVFVTGGDYRNIGFSVGDILLIYSDADPKGQEVTVTVITSTTSGVKLTFTVNEDGVSAINPGLYETTDNAYVQNQASFTNGKSRGMTRATVEEFIKRVQDRIDSETHNAWRPSMVHAEYINFDTYKPYRRRYYTDYVGTSPLLFRNVQQILRIEMWQGDEYREICGAEARIQLPDNIRSMEGKSIVISPGNGSAATLTAGNLGASTSSQWAVDFDRVTSAQNLADLINKEDRVSKSAVEFSPAFTLEGSTSNVSVHNEFLASANSDYGAGEIKLTSMRQTKAGEVCSIVTTSTDIELSHTSNASTTTGTGGAVTLSVTTGGSGYTGATGVATTGGSGTGLTVNTTVSTGAVTGVAVNAAGSGYKIGDVITVSGGTGSTLTISAINVVASTTVSAVNTTGFASAGVILVNSEVFSYTGKTATSFTGCVNVVGTPLTTLATLSSDLTLSQHRLQLDLQAGSTSGDQARLKDWWLDHEMGIIYFNNSYPFFEFNAIKVAYIYGERYLEKAIEEAATKLVATDLLMSDDRSVLIPEGSQNVDLGAKIQIFRNQAKAILGRYKEIVVFE